MSSPEDEVGAIGRRAIYAQNGTTLESVRAFMLGRINAAKRCVSMRRELCRS